MLSDIKFALVEDVDDQPARFEVSSALQVEEPIITLSLETDDPEVCADLISKNTTDFHLHLEKESSRQGALETKLLYDFLLEVSAGVTAEVIAHYIITNLAPRAKWLHVNGIRVTSEEECKAALAGDGNKPEAE